MKFRPGPDNPRWRGGRTVTVRGYVRITSGPWAGWYEHRALVARNLQENAISAAVMPREIPAGFEVHHMDFDRRNNEPDNLLLIHPAFHDHARHLDRNGKRAQRADLPEEWFEKKQGEGSCLLT